MTGEEARLDPGDELLFVPLGGAGEIGMNLNLYGHAGKWVMVDLGITFPEGDVPGVEVLMPDPGFIEERREDLLGIVLTHAHEDHLGAVPYLWRRLRKPVYASPFAAALLRHKLREAGLLREVPLHEVPLGGSFRLGPFEFELVTLTHSIPEPNGLAIRTPLGTVMHTGDWKIDPDPLIGEVTDSDRLRRLGEEGVLAMVCDSTNVLSPGHSGSEGDLRESLIDLVRKCENRVVIACFASNVARLETVAAVAAATGRSAALVGRSMWRIYEAAQEAGYLTDIPPFLDDSDIVDLPRDKVLLACTGTQGEPRAALVRIANGSHRSIALEAGDTVIFSSKIIPGNERPILRLHNALARQGVEVITERDHFVHVSGHPNRDELVQMYQWIRPRVAVPVHGESRHLIEHARLARECQVPESVTIENGDVLRLAPGPVEVVARVETGRLALDGTNLVQLGSGPIRRRQQMLWNGAAMATLVMDAEGRLLTEPQLSIPGLIDPEDGAADLKELAATVRAAVESMPPGARRDDGAVREIAYRTLRRAAHALCGKRPVTEIHLVRV